MTKTNERSIRKDEHVRYVLNQTEKNETDFNRVHLVHHSLPDFNLEDIDLSSSFGVINWAVPLYINAMTGGSEWTKDINEKLALVAKATGLPMSLGSMHAAIKDPSVESSFSIARKMNPNGFLMANVGADVPVEHVHEIIELIDANALQIHINAAQELIMPEGDRQFKNWKQNIQQIINTVDIPVIVKEVGFGMSRETISSLLELGVIYIDISGRGGTNFAEIENLRRKNQEMDYMQTWGQSTVISLIESEHFQKNAHILASGGVTTPLDAVKCLALGARAVGLSKIVLERVMNDGVDNTVQFINDFIYQMKKITLLTNSRTLKDLNSTPRVLSSELENWKTQRMGNDDE
ncbi:type 2 isopentenyl-diphosphate Delta-isomerase [Jeotgalicoccus halotolerans]|uniref:Isopentenyl-diphosphate delta-isomerase n=1 Tax=Jeotgalicoccus halotolerans TaxID=157227 RepID=A0A3E0AUD8_9STAP|nr:type 2 isopentenyl-diphosphate Delta-isomerase [Jeotgalicoccus halotolerans]REG23360.1 isopentenyl-diphosphate delta-isomerase [Jeotgalicoccus halotolerans]